MWRAISGPHSCIHQPADIEIERQAPEVDRLASLPSYRAQRARQAGFLHRESVCTVSPFGHVLPVS